MRKRAHSRSSGPETGWGYLFKTLCLNIQFYPLFLIFSILAIPCLTLVVAVLAIFISHRRAMRRFRRAVAWYGFVIIRVLPYPWVKVRYRDFCRTESLGGHLIVCNHRSASDPFLMAVLPLEGIQLVNVWPLRLPVLGLMAKLAGYISINEIDVEKFYEKGKQLLEDDISIIAFPEGTRSGSKEMGSFHSSIFRLALQTRKPIVPLCISGNERIPTRGSLVLHPGVITLHRLPATGGDDYDDLSPFQLKGIVRDRMAEELRRMDTPSPATEDRAIISVQDETQEVEEPNNGNV